MRYPQVQPFDDKLCCGIGSFPRGPLQPSGFILAQDLPFVEAALFGIASRSAVLFTTAVQRSEIADRIVENISSALGRRLRVFSLAQSTDATDLLGQFEQLSADRTVKDIISAIIEMAEVCSSRAQAEGVLDRVLCIAEKHSSIASPEEAIDVLK